MHGQKADQQDEKPSTEYSSFQRLSPTHPCHIVISIHEEQRKAGKTGQYLGSAFCCGTILIICCAGLLRSFFQDTHGCSTSPDAF